MQSNEEVRPYGYYVRRPWYSPYPLEALKINEYPPRLRTLTFATEAAETLESTTKIQRQAFMKAPFEDFSGNKNRVEEVSSNNVNEFEDETLEYEEGQAEMEEKKDEFDVKNAEIENGKAGFGDRDIRDDFLDEVRVKSTLGDNLTTRALTAVPNFPPAVSNNTNETAVVCVCLALALGVLSAALIAALICARRGRRKSPPSPATASAPPVLVHPPRDPPPPAMHKHYLTQEINFSLPGVRSCSMGELRAGLGASGPDGAVSEAGGGTPGTLSTPATGYLRSNSFTNSCELGTLDPSLYKDEFLDHDIHWPEGHVGRVWFTLCYDAAAERLQVHLIKLRHLPSRTLASANACDPYVRLQLLPDERRVVQSKQKKKTCNPTFDEVHVFQVPSRTLGALTLRLSVLDSGRAAAGSSSRALLGHALVPLEDLIAQPDDRPLAYKMDLEKEEPEPTSELGEVLVSLLYNEHLQKLTVTVVEARKLKLLESGRRECWVRVTSGRRARRTAAARVAADGSVLLSERFRFALRPDEAHSASVTVHAIQPSMQPYGKDRVIGKFVLGSYMFTRGKALHHWNTAMATPMVQAQQWHVLTNYD